MTSEVVCCGPVGTVFSENAISWAIRRRPPQRECSAAQARSLSPGVGVERAKVNGEGLAKQIQTLDVGINSGLVPQYFTTWAVDAVQRQILCSKVHIRVQTAKSSIRNDEITHVIARTMQIAGTRPGCLAVEKMCAHPPSSLSGLTDALKLLRINAVVRL